MRIVCTYEIKEDSNGLFKKQEFGLGQESWGVPKITNPTRSQNKASVRSFEIKTLGGLPPIPVRFTSEASETETPSRYRKLSLS